CRRADLLFAATGRAQMVKREFVKPGATVIDVGINRVAGGDGDVRLVADVAFAEVAQIAGAITPVPGGVGPMTIACLLINTVRAACPGEALQSGKYIQRGAGRHSLCAKCNNDTGTWYGTPYVNFARQVLILLHRSKGHMKL